MPANSRWDLILRLKGYLWICWSLCKRKFNKSFMPVSHLMSRVELIVLVLHISVTITIFIDGQEIGFHIHQAPWIIFPAMSSLVLGRPSPYPERPFLLVQSGPSVKLTTHRHLLPILQVPAAVPPFSPTPTSNSA